MNPLIRAYAYFNHLLKGVVSYFLRVESAGTLDVKDVVSRIDRLPFRIAPDDYTYLVNLFLEECLELNLRGFTVNTPLFRSSPTIRGSIAPADLFRTFKPAPRNTATRTAAGQGKGGRNSARNGMGESNGAWNMAGKSNAAVIRNVTHPSVSLNFQPSPSARKAASALSIKVCGEAIPKKSPLSDNGP